VILSQWLGPAWCEEGGAIFLDDILQRFPGEPPAGASLTLLDHNNLKGELAVRGWGPLVSSIIDHHLDEGKHPNVLGVHRQIDFDTLSMKGCGSACSMVTLNVLKSGGSWVDAPLSRALLSVIALDTINMSPHKATPTDYSAVEGLSGVLVSQLGASASPSVESLFSELNALRSNRGWWLSLSTHAALGLDFKAFDLVEGGGKLGTSALMVGLTDYFSGGNGDNMKGLEEGGGAALLLVQRIEEAKDFARGRGCSVLLALSQVSLPSLMREIYFIPVDHNGEALIEVLVEGLTGKDYDFDLVQLPVSLTSCQANSGTMGMEVITPPLTRDSSHPFAPLRAFRQGNIAHTRKTIVPAILRQCERRRAVETEQTMSLKFG